MEWISIHEKLPDPKELGDGNVCKVEVKYKTSFHLPEEDEILYGNSGCMGEGNGFFTSRPVAKWRPIPKTTSSTSQ